MNKDVLIKYLCSLSLEDAWEGAEKAWNLGDLLAYNMIINHAIAIS